MDARDDNLVVIPRWVSARQYRSTTRILESLMIVNQIIIKPDIQLLLIIPNLKQDIEYCVIEIYQNIRKARHHNYQCENQKDANLL